MKHKLCIFVVLSMLWPVVTQSSNIQPNSPSINASSYRQPDLNDARVMLSLMDAVWLGLRHNPQIRSEYLNRVAQKFELTVAADTFNPQWNLRASYKQSKSQQGTQQEYSTAPTASLMTTYGTQLSLSWSQQFKLDHQDGRSRNDGVDISLIQPLLRGSGREINTIVLRQADLREQINRLQLKASVSQTISNIILAYHRLLTAQQRLVVDEAALERTEEQLVINKALIKAGRMAETELLQSEAQLANQRLQLEQTRNERYLSEQDLLRLLGITRNTSIFASDTLSATYVQFDVQQAFKVAEVQEPQYLATLLAGEYAAMDIISAKDAQRWSLALKIGSREQRNYSANTARQRSWEQYAEFELEVPLSNLSARQQLLQAKVNASRTKIELNEARLDLQQRIRQAVYDLDTRWKQYELAQQAVSLSNLNLEVEQEKLRAGRSSNYQINNYQSDLKNAEYARLNALIGYLAAQTELDLAMGTTIDTWKVELND